jgi:hypothetical protein
MSLPAEITGIEPPADTAALDALIFYWAFNASDLKSLGANWADGESPSMDNPIGGIRRGWPAIREGYAKLFSGPAPVAWRSTISQRKVTMTITSSWDLKKACAKPPLELRIRTSRWFVKERGAWRQLHHDGSIDEPAILAEYQRAILKRRSRQQVPYAGSRDGNTLDLLMAQHRRLLLPAFTFSRLHPSRLRSRGKTLTHPPI